MDLQQALKFANDVLDDPLRAKFTGMWSGFSAVTEVVRTAEELRFTGEIETVCLPMFSVIPFRFSPGNGFHRCDEVAVLDVSFPEVTPCLRTMCPGDIITCMGRAKVYDAKIDFGDDTIICRWPQLQSALPWNAIHLFSGGFLGWSRALGWLAKREPSCVCSQQIYIDADPCVMECWSHAFGKPFMQSPIMRDTPRQASQHVGVCTEVADRTIARLALFHNNVIETLSPPCISWSRGGKSLGINSKAGFAFIEAIFSISVTQPVIVCAECADETTKHPHFPLIQALFKLLGYKLVWQQVVPTHMLTNCFRTRWLAVWLRNDIPGKPIDAFFELKDVPITPWFAPLNRLFVPESIKTQLALDEQARKMYADPELLPPAKRFKHATEADVLRSRRVSHDQPLPTLCASYSAQHLLDARHLRSKGIFASLQIIDDCVLFLDPLLFVVLFGTCDKICLPTDLNSAFHMLGNAICVPHSLLACSVGFASILDFDWHPANLVLECWSDRLSSQSAIVLSSSDHTTVLPIGEFLAEPPVCLPEQMGGVSVFITPVASLRHFSGFVALDLCVEDFLTSCVGIPAYVLPSIAMKCDQHPAAWSNTIGRLAHIGRTWKIAFDEKVFLVVDLEVTGIEDLPATAPLQLDLDPNLVECTVVAHHCTNQQLFSHSQFLHVMKIFEAVGCPKDDAPERPPTGHVLFFPVNVSVPVLVKHEQLELNVKRILGPCACKLAVFESPALSLLRQSLVVVVMQDLVPPDSVICVIEDISTDRLLCAAFPQLVPHSVAISFASSRFRVEHLNGEPIRSTDQLVLHHADILSVRPDQQKKAAVFAGGHHSHQGTTISLPDNATFFQRCEYIVNTHGWLASDELAYLANAIQEATPIPVPHFEIMLWQGGPSDLESLSGAEPDFPVHTCTWVFVLSDGHWILCITEVDPSHAHVVIQGCPQDQHASLTCALVRILDLSRSNVAVSFLDLQPLAHMCGWTYLHQFAARSDFHPPQVSASFSVPHTAFVDAIEDALSASRDEWRIAGAPPELCNFAHEARRLFLLHLALHTPISQIAEGYHAARPQPPTAVQTTHDHVLDRLHDMWLRPSWMPSDVLDDLLETLRVAHPATLFAPPCLWEPDAGVFRSFNHFQCDARPFGHVIVFILWDTHWITCEILKNTSAWISVRGPAIYRFEIGSMLTALTSWFGLDPALTHATFQPHFPLPNMCGWSLALELFQRFQVDFNAPAAVHHLRLALHPHALVINAIRSLALQQWQHDLVPQAMITFGQSAIVLSLCKILEGRGVRDYGAGGGDESKNPAPKASSSSATTVDPWLKRDPWQSRPRPQTRWEDLLLAEDHPFVSEQQKKLNQVHRLQISANTGGLVLTTKQHLQELSQTRCKQPLAAIIPAIDSNGKGPDITSQGPYEVVLRDPNAGQSYKRLVSLVVFAGKVSYHLHSPAHSFTTAAVSELVVEIDSRLVPKDDFESYKNAAAFNIKKLFFELLPSSSGHVTFFSFRHNMHPSASKGDIQLQCIVKLPTTLRGQVLELSGKGGILTRDFLDKGTQSSDVSILPRFAPATQKDLRELLITLKPIQGQAGVALTRRGLAPRIWNSAIASARQALVPDDNRLCAENFHVVPRISFEAAGWPSGTTPQDVVTAVNKATSCPPVPMRTYRVGGVNVWVLAFESAPDAKLHQFTVQINQQLHEILLTEAPAPSAGKGSAKGKGKKREETVVPKNNPPPLLTSDRQRLDSLEAKFDSLGKQVSSIEEKQTAFESKIDSKFETINDSLRQLLQQSQPRVRESNSGDTPPPKHPKC